MSGHNTSPILTKFLAESGNIDIDRPSENDDLVRPDLGKDLFPCIDMRGIAQKKLKNLEFGLGR